MLWSPLSLADFLNNAIETPLSEFFPEYADSIRLGGLNPYNVFSPLSTSRQAW
jgi:hypothetical protein